MKIEGIISIFSHLFIYLITNEWVEILLEHNNNFISRALVDYSGFSKTIKDIHGRFNLLNFLDFCSIIEGIVLHDKLIIVGGKKLLEGAYELLQPLFREGIIEFETSKSTPAKLSADYNPSSLNNNRFYDNRTKSYPLPGYGLNDAWFETGRLIGAERTHNLPSLTLLRQRPFYEKEANVGQEHSICDLIAKYEELRDSLLKLRQSVTLEIIPYIVIPIPPLPLLLLQRTDKLDDIMYNILEIRHEFRKLRDSLTALREDLADTYIQPIKKLKIINSWKMSWDSLNKYSRSNDFFAMANATSKMIEYKDLAKGIGVDAIRWADLIELFLITCVNAFYSWKVRVLHSMADNYLSTPDIEINHEIYRLFKHEVTKNDFDIFYKLGIRSPAKSR